jgi:hypothetical protein
MTLLLCSKKRKSQTLISFNSFLAVAFTATLFAMQGLVRRDDCSTFWPIRLRVGPFSRRPVSLASWARFHYLETND